MRPRRRVPADATGRHRAGLVETESYGLFEAVLVAHGDALEAFARRLTADPADAEDLVQETLLRAWQHPSALDGSKGSARAWLFSVARNLAVDQWRREGRWQRHQGQIPGLRRRDSEGRLGEPGGSDLANRVVEDAVVAVAFESLSEDHRQVLLHAIWLDEPVAQIAESIGVPPGTVKSRVHYALKALRLALEEMGYLS